MRLVIPGPPTARRLLLGEATATYDPGNIGDVTAETAASTTFTFATLATKSTPYLGKAYFFPLVDDYGRPVLGTAAWVVMGRLTLLDVYAAANWSIQLGVSTLTDLSSASVPSVWGGVHGNTAGGPTGRVHVGANGAAANATVDAYSVCDVLLAGKRGPGDAMAGPATSATTASHVEAGATSTLTVWGSSQLYLGVNFTTPGAAFSGAKAFHLDVNVSQRLAP